MKSLYTMDITHQMNCNHYSVNCTSILHEYYYESISCHKILNTMYNYIQTVMIDGASHDQEPVTDGIRRF